MPNATLADVPTPVWRTTFSDDGKLAFCSSGNRGRAYRTSDWQPLTPAIQCDDIIDHERFSPDGQHLLTASRDHLIRVWDWNSAQPVASYRHANGVTDAVWLPDAQHIFSTSDGDNFILWNATNGQVQNVFTNESGVAHTVAVSPDGRWLVGGSDVRLALWNAATGTRVWLGAADRGYVHELRFSPDGRWLANGTETGDVQLQRVDTGELVFPPLQHGACVREIHFSPDGKSFVVTGDKLVARVWNSMTGEPLLPPLTLPGGLMGADFSHDGRWLLVANDQAFQVWDALSGVPVSSVQPCPEGVSGATTTDRTHLTGVSVTGKVLNFEMADLTWPREKIMSAARLLSGAEVDAVGGLGPALAAGDSATPARRREAEATWQWLREELKAFSQPPR